MKFFRRQAFQKHIKDDFGGMEQSTKYKCSNSGAASKDGDSPNYIMQQSIAKDVARDHVGSDDS